MTRPLTGGVRPSVGDGFNTANAHKALEAYVLMRDHDGVNTSMAFVEENGVWQSGFHPFAADGQFRTDLFIEQGGAWYNVGGVDPKGLVQSSKIDVKKEHFLQTRQVVRTDITSREDALEFPIAEDHPLADTLRADAPLASTPALGTPDYARKDPVEMDGRLRQIILYTRDKGGFYDAHLYPAVSLEDAKDRTFTAEDLILLGLKWGQSVDAFSGYAYARFRSGPGWVGNPGPPVFSEAPVATPGATGAVTLVFPAPTGPATPFTYTVKKTEIDTGVVSDLTLGTATVVSGVVTQPGSDLTATKQYTFQVYATNAADKVSISPKSNTITAT